MSHFAKINSDNIVTEVIVAEQDYINSGARGDQFLWVQTSYNGNFRKQFAAVGDTYDKVNDIFIRAKPYVGWTLDSLHDWQPPTPEPDDASESKFYRWDNETTSWVALPPRDLEHEAAGV